MCTLGVTVCAETWCQDGDGTLLLLKLWTSPDTAFATMLAKSELTPADAILASAQASSSVVALVMGYSALFAEAGVDGSEFFKAFSANPYMVPPEAPDKYLSLAFMCLALVRSETDSHQEEVIAGAWFVINCVSLFSPTVAKAVWEAGFLEVFQTSIARFNPMERVSRRQLIPSAILDCMKNVILSLQTEGIEVVQ
eukprot:COSAG02_NODE_7167_length_3141_cov_3.358317_5_plen_195_part_01